MSSVGQPPHDKLPSAGEVCAFKSTLGQYWQFELTRCLTYNHTHSTCIAIVPSVDVPDGELVGKFNAYVCLVSYEKHVFCCLTGCQKPATNSSDM